LQRRGRARAGGAGRLRRPAAGWRALGLAAALAGAAGAQPAAPAVPAGLGVNIHFTNPRPGELQLLAGAGFTLVRMDLAWSGTERQPGRYDFRAYDRLLAALDQQQLRALLILDYSHPHYDQGLSPYSAAGRQAFARWAAAAVQHFRGRGVIWELYNEPNIRFWKPQPSVTNYIALAREVGRALRAAAPDEQYVGPATSQIDFQFLEACFRAGLLACWTGVTVHPYRRKMPETVLPEYARLRALIDRYAPPGRTIPILSGEWGYSTAWDQFDDERQARYLPRQFLVNLMSGVPVSIWYDWHDDGPDAQEAEHNFGIVRHRWFKGRAPAYDLKPAYGALQALVANLRGLRFSRRLAVGQADDYVLLFAGDGRACYAAWTAARPHAVTLPDGRTVNLTGAPQYLPAAAK